MKKGQNTLELAVGSWLVALLAGTLAGVMLWVLGGWGFIQSVFVGGVIFVILGLVISTLMAKPLPAPGEVTIEPKTPGDTAAPVTKAPPTVEANKDKIKPSAPLPGQADLAARKGSWTYSAAPAAPTAKAAPEKKAAPAQKAAPETKAAAASAPASGSDDLKLIGGVGPALEKKLHEAGITTFAQIANMTPEEVEKVEEKLSFKGRMQRDDWFGQAKILAEGGDTEFSKKKRKS